MTEKMPAEEHAAGTKAPVEENTVGDTAPVETATVSEQAPAEASAAGEKRPAEEPPTKEKRAEDENGPWKRRREYKFEPREGGADDGPRMPKRKVALLFGYCGTGYHGLQLNPGAKTIEGDLFKALAEAGAISAANSDDLHKNGFQRAARTDKGVHAAGNVVLLKMIVEDPEIVAKVNEKLPAQIRVWGFQRTTKGFNCRKQCSLRVYEYLLPTFALIGPNATSELGSKVKRDLETQGFWEDLAKAYVAAGLSQQDLDTAAAAVGKNPVDPETGKYTAAAELGKVVRGVENAHRRAYRVSAARLEALQEVLSAYVGPHNYHNYTIGKPFKDPLSVRYMKRLTVSAPFVIEGTEWLSVKIHGQLFMLNQIRKMISMAVMCVRCNTPVGIIEQSFQPKSLNIPKAPALGLLLEQPVYDAYNDKLEKVGHGKVEFVGYAAEMEAFKRAFIYDKIYAEEVKENTFHAFLSFIDGFKGGDFDYFGEKEEKEEKEEEKAASPKPLETEQPADPPTNTPA